MNHFIKIFAFLFLFVFSASLNLKDVSASENYYFFYDNESIAVSPEKWKIQGNTIDSDGDGILDQFDLDDDNDGIVDTDEGCVLMNATELQSGTFNRNDLVDQSVLVSSTNGDAAHGKFSDDPAISPIWTGWTRTQTVDYSEGQYIVGDSGYPTSQDISDGLHVIPSTGSANPIGIPGGGGYASMSFYNEGLEQVANVEAGVEYTLTFEIGLLPFYDRVGGGILGGGVASFSSTDFEFGYEGLGGLSALTHTFEESDHPANSLTLADFPSYAEAVSAEPGPTRLELNPRWTVFTTTFTPVTSGQVRIYIINRTPDAHNSVILMDNVFLSRPVNSMNCIDTDGDGITDNLDLDSDNDGCYDVVEAGHGQTVVNDSLISGVFGANGLAATVESNDTENATVNYSIAQTDGINDFQRNIVNSCICAIGLDSDGDGVSDVCDLDDDNDGILDMDEGCVLMNVTELQSSTFNRNDLVNQSVLVSSTNGDAAHGKFSDDPAISPIWTGWTRTQTVDYSEGQYIVGDSGYPTSQDISDGLHVISSTGSANPVGISGGGGYASMSFYNEGLEQVANVEAGVEYTLTFEIGLLPFYDRVGGGILGGGVASFSSTDFEFGYEGLGGLSALSQTYDESDHPANSLTLADFPSYADAVSAEPGPTRLELDPHWTVFTTTFTPVTSGQVRIYIINRTPDAHNSVILMDNVFLSAPLNSMNCIDTDGDGITDNLDLDSDNDGCYDVVEAGHGQSVVNDSLIGGVFGMNGLSTMVESDDTENATVNYSIAQTGGVNDFQNNAVKLACPEICDNGIDDDGDGLVDCYDPDCGNLYDCLGICPTGSLTVYRWNGIAGNQLTNLTNHPNFPDSPSDSLTITNFDLPDQIGESYGTLTKGYLIPSQTGTYRFNVTGDDYVEFYLSTDHSNANKSLTAYIHGWTGTTSHYTYSSQTSANITLEADKIYYFELLHKEGGGGDHFQVFWRTPSNGNWNIIPGTNLAPFNCPREICDNGIDDDGDGLIDCADPNCGGSFSLNLTGDTAICNGETVALTALATGGIGNSFTYSWDNGLGNGANKMVSPNVTTTYTVTATNSYGCTQTELVTVTIQSCPEVCDNGIDDDGDGLVDSNDPDCIVCTMTANDDVYDNRCPGLEIKGNVTYNDLNFDNMVFSLIGNTSYGNVQLNSNGIFEYTPTSSHCGIDEFFYRFCNQDSTCCDTAKVTLDFRENDAPILVNVPDDLTINCDEEIPVPAMVSAIDNCLSIVVEREEESTQGSDSCSLNSYTITRTWTVTDGCGNKTSDEQLIEIQDITAPSIFRIYTMPNGKRLVAGTIANVTHRWKTVHFPIGFSTTPLIFTQLVSKNEASPVAVRMRNISKNQFEIKLQEEDANANIRTGESIAWMAMEIGDEQNHNIFEANLFNVNHNWTSVGFTRNYTNTPAFFMTMQSIADSDPAYARHHNLSTTGVELKIEEELSDDVDITHTAEQVGFLVMDTTAQFIYNHRNESIGEVGVLSINDNWTTVALKQTYFNPIVIANGLSYNGADPSITRVRNITANSFEIHVEEWDYLDGTHTIEQVSYMVIEGTVPLNSEIICGSGTDSLEIDKDWIVVDNCDNNVPLHYEERDSVAGNSIYTIRAWSAIDNCANSTHYEQKVICQGVALSAKTVLQGAMMNNNGDGLMRDDLRKLGYLPLIEPYTDLPNFEHQGEGGLEQVNSEIFDVEGPQAIVDWIFLELRPKDTPEQVIATKSVLLQRDGDLVSVSGDTIIPFVNMPHGAYFVAVKHRNHLTMMTLSTYNLNASTIPFIDFTYEFTSIYGHHSAVMENGIRGQWAGDINNDNKIIYQGPNNDQIYLFLHVFTDKLNITGLPNFISNGYTTNDFNLDGSVIFQGPNNDKASFLWNTTLKHPSNQSNLLNFIIQLDLPE